MIGEGGGQAHRDLAAVISGGMDILGTERTEVTESSLEGKKPGASLPKTLTPPALRLSSEALLSSAICAVHVQPSPVGLPLRETSGNWLTDAHSDLLPSALCFLPVPPPYAAFLPEGRD